MNMESRNDRISKAVFAILLLVFSLFCLFPLVFALIGSFTSESEVILKGFTLFPEKLTLDTYGPVDKVIIPEQIPANMTHRKAEKAERRMP